jgi:hypothetical protein
MAGRTAADRALIGDVRAGLADPARAAAQQAYMKSSMPYYGVTSPETRRIARASFAHPLPSFRAWRDTVFELWR